jgi:hypothetical protein
MTEEVGLALLSALFSGPAPRSRAQLGGSGRRAGSSYGMQHFPREPLPSRTDMHRFRSEAEEAASRRRWAYCAKGERPGADAYWDVLGAPRAAKPDKAGGPTPSARRKRGWWQDLRRAGRPARRASGRAGQRGERPHAGWALKWGPRTDSHRVPSTKKYLSNRRPPPGAQRRRRWAGRPAARFWTRFACYSTPRRAACSPFSTFCCSAAFSLGACRFTTSLSTVPLNLKGTS